MREDEKRARRLHRAAVVVDAHAHPSLKTSLFGLDFGARHPTGGLWWPFTMRADLPKLRAGGVDVLLAAAYLPEEGLGRDCWALRALQRLVPRWRRFSTGDPFRRTTTVLETFEAAVRWAAEKNGGTVGFARSLTEMDTHLAAGRTVVIHAVEGAHSLAGDAGNVGRLFEMGVCLLTLAHFYENEVAAPVETIPPRFKPPGCFRAPKDLHKGLTDFGRVVVEEMLRLGVLVDLAHCTPKARSEVFALAGTRRPLLFSHVGVSTRKKDAMNPDPAEIRRVAETGGAVGVIFMNRFLSPDPGKNGLRLIVETVREIVRCGGIETAAIGTDFDGFTDPPDDVKDSSELPKVTASLMRAGYSDREVEMVLGGNMLRVLRAGWGKA